MSTRKPTLAALAKKADEFETIRNERLALQKEVDKLKKKENELQDFLINNISKSDATGVVGKLVKITVDTEDVPVVEDVDKFRKYLNRTKDFSLCQALKPASSAVKERWDAGKEVPGIGKFTRVKLKRNKV